jgi:hypothetical protein
MALERDNGMVNAGADFAIIHCFPCSPKQQWKSYQMDSEAVMRMRWNRDNTFLAIGVLIFLLVVAWKVFASVQDITPNGNGGAVADGGTGRWTTYGSGSSAWGRLDDGSFAEGVRETTVNDSCNFTFDDYTLPAGAVVSSVEMYVYACLTSGTSATLRADVCDGSTCSNGSNTAIGPPEISECDQATIYRNMTTAPDGGAWDQTDINSIVVRLILISASGAGTASVSELDMRINYTIPSGGVRRIKLLSTH